MSSPTKAAGTGSPESSLDPNPLTTASFSPSKTSLVNRQRSTILMQQKSPLLVATPPQITRALAFSHPFILPLNKLTGLISWSSGDPWESFLLVAGFWAVVLYGDIITRWAGPPVVVVALILGMYSRRYSPLSSTGWTGEKVKGHKKQESEGSMRHSKSLDEIVETLNIFTSRCNLLLDPLLQLTDFLSTQRTATSATTRPALTTLFLRILLLTPVWILLTPLQILTTRRIILTSGTLILSWHSRPARVSRTILWRSLTVRKLLSFATGLTFMGVPPLPPRKEPPPPLPPRHSSQHNIANSIATNEKKALVGLRFTFVIYENQRRWLGLGWTTSMFAYERAAWTDEHLNPSPPKDEFELPLVEDENAAWQWVGNSEWRIDGAGKTASGPSGKAGSEGWVYYDNKVRSCDDPEYCLDSDIRFSGMMVVVKTVGVVIPAGGSGIEMLSWSRSPLVWLLLQANHLLATLPRRTLLPKMKENLSRQLQILFKALKEAAVVAVAVKLDAVVISGEAVTRVERAVITQIK